MNTPKRRKQKFRVFLLGFGRHDLEYSPLAPLEYFSLRFHCDTIESEDGDGFNQDK